MWTGALDRLLAQVIREGSLTITDAQGRSHTYGDGKGEAVHVTFTDPALPRKLILAPEMALGEGYMDGRLVIGDDDLYGFLGLVIRNIAKHDMPWFERPMRAARYGLRWLDQFNPVSRARRNAAHHYDLSRELYDLFLDEDRQYSCAYFARPDMTLDEAQEAKKTHIARKLLIEPGMRVLDIGCGWGGLALTLARDYGAHVTGVTLSREQHALATERARQEGLSDKVEFRLMDYREVEETFDRVVSVGMFEHVGVPYYAEFFRDVHDRLTDTGIALIHFIGRASPPGITSPWIAKYIFPGGYVPAMSEVLPHIERHDLYTTDIEVWRLHYAETLANWYKRFMANIDKARALYDDRFCRMWRYYLVASELTFRLNKQVVFQFQLSKVQDSVPLTRDYLYSDGRDAAAPAAREPAKAG